MRSWVSKSAEFYLLKKRVSQLINRGHKQRILKHKDRGDKKMGKLTHDIGSFRNWHVNVSRNWITPAAEKQL